MTDRAAELYAETVGTDALERQKKQRGERHPCCGELVDHGHHLACSKRPADEPPPLIAGQQGWL